MQDGLANDSGPNAKFYSGSSSPALSCNLIPSTALVPTDELFKQFIKAYLEINQEPRQPLIECKQLFKAKISKLSYGKLHIDCYHFCQ